MAEEERRKAAGDGDGHGVEAGPASAVRNVTGLTCGDTEYLVYYDRGVGTGAWLDPLRGGAFGEGLAHNVRQAYRFLATWYQPGDEIYVFGFSRGAFTARSLVGYIGATGLLRCEECTPLHEGEAWGHYRTPPQDRLSGIWSALTPLVHRRDQLRVRCLGVFDTVGALGIPVEKFRRLNRSRSEFHDVTLSSLSEVNLHAIAVDEHRMPFQAAVWRKPQFKSYNTITEQVWFPGVHSDIGGGYVQHFGTEASGSPTLDDITLDWMMKRASHHAGLPFDFDPEDAVRRASVEAPQHESMTAFYRTTGGTAVRSVQNRPVEATRGRIPVCYDRLLDSVGEMIHISVLERLGRTITVNQGKSRRQAVYDPPNVRAVLGRIRDTYAPRLAGESEDAGAGSARAELLVVGWDGTSIPAPRPGEAPPAPFVELLKRLGLWREDLPLA